MSCGCSRRVARPVGPCRSTAGRSRSARPCPRRSTASTSPCSRPAPTSSRELAPAAVARGRDGHRQLVGVADGPDGPAGRVAGQPRRPRGAPGHRRQPELLDDAARAGADGAARRGRPRAGRRRHLPVGVGHRRRCDRRARGPDPGARRPASPRSRRSTRTRSRSTRCPRSTSSSTTATPRRSGRSSTRAARSCSLPDLRDLVHGRPRSRSSSATPRRSTSRRATRSRPIARASCSRPCPGVIVQDDPAEHRLPAGDRGRRPRRDLRRPGPTRRVDRGRPRARLLGRVRQPAQGRGDERRRARRGAPRARLDPAGVDAWSAPVSRLAAAAVVEATA